MEESDVIYVIPIGRDKPLKIIFDLPCPINPDVRCEHSKMESDKNNLEFSIKCTNFNNCKLNKLNGGFNNEI